MDELIELIGRDTFIALFTYAGTTIRAGKGEKVDVLHGLLASFGPFFIMMCILFIVEEVLGWFALVPSAKAFGSLGGIFGFLSNSWLIGLSKNGKQIEDEGAIQSLGTFVKAIINYKKQP